MREGGLPYQDFSQMARAAASGLALTDGLAPRDRRRLLERKAHPQLVRLWPRDPQCVEAEVARLLA